MRKEDMEQNESSLKKRVRKDKAKARHKRRFRYSFLTIILLVCLVQMTIGGLLNNITKLVAYHGKLIKLESKQIAAEARNAELKKNIKNFSTTTAMESIGRNNLKMAGKDEVLVIVNKHEVQESENQKHNKIRLKNNEKHNDRSVRP